jgi:uncharacterized phage protein (TIGR01671 family)
MRQIKFKIYDKELKESHVEELQDLCEDDYWYDGETDVWSVLYDSHNEQERFVALQYTGLKDKNGTEIYEGDILQILGGWRSQGFYEYDEKVCIKDYIFNSYNLMMIINQIGNESVEVIGNIYDNPDLLKEAKI